MYGIFTYILAIFGVNVSKYSIHGAFGYIYMYPNNICIYIYICKSGDSHPKVSAVSATQ